MRLGLGLHITGLRAGGEAFDPATLFASGEQGAWFEPSPSTCFTDTGGTTPASVGDPVARINDLSGNGNHATQATLASRPILRQTGGGLYYLEFDGVDDSLAVGSINFSASDKVSVFCGSEKDVDHFGVITEFSENASNNNGAFGIWTFSPNSYIFRSRGTIATGAITSGYTASHKAVISGLSDISGNSAIIRVDGVQVAEDTSDQGTGNFLTYPLNIGRRAELGGTGYFNGKIFGLIVRGATTSGDDLTNTESYVANKTGVTI